MPIEITLTLTKYRNGDLYCAIRDYLHVIHNFPDNKEAYQGLVQCLVAIKWMKEAREWLEYYQIHHSDGSDGEELDKLGKVIAAGDAIKEERNEDDRIPEKTITEDEKMLRRQARDYEMRFLGHCNTTTDIKEANFLGEYIYVRGFCFSALIHYVTV